MPTVSGTVTDSNGNTASWSATWSVAASATVDSFTASVYTNTQARLLWTTTGIDGVYVGRNAGTLPGQNPWESVNVQPADGESILNNLQAGSTYQVYIEPVVGGVRQPSLRQTRSVTMPVPNPAESYPMIFGACIATNQTTFNDRNTRWGPVRMWRDYDSSNGPMNITQYGWWNFFNANNFNYLALSVTLPYASVPSGSSNAGLQALINSWPVGVKGTIMIGNEPNQTDKNINSSDYRAACEYIIDTFGDRPLAARGQEQVFWGSAFAHYNIWGSARSGDGKLWIPRRPNDKFVLVTQPYGEDHWTLPANTMGYFMSAVAENPAWLWGIGETSAQEHPTDPTRKGEWWEAWVTYCRNNGASFYLPFDRTTGGSAVVAGTTTTAQMLKAAHVPEDDNNWT
jgi:hypothetical protein